MDELGDVCGMKVYGRTDLPMGVGLFLNADGKRLGTIVNLDIETLTNPLTKMAKPDFGSMEITGEVTCYFEDDEAYASFFSNAKDVGYVLALQTVSMGDQLFRDKSRKARKYWWRKRKNLTAMLKRGAARERRRLYGLATF